ncbi:Inner membrane protein YqiK [Poriferisphaera corsica]|uniref:Inner membrane protein YqiK n=1 Tax=Poriferisphaera corsica TaxID=2528020 RepID=A0A517YZC5_9BACT|nr:flotillin family protein [Poriferisphaera corsica]QDU35596.1 Inner membrane protein YqiK [Poriferisphaera corsica]
MGMMMLAAGEGLVFAVIGVAVAVFLFIAMYAATRYKRCPSNKVLVVYGSVGGERTAKCLHGGGALILPLIQDYAYLNLEPMTIEIDLTNALSKKNIRVNVPSTFTIGISTEADIMNNAAERLLGLTEIDIATQARDIILGQMRLVIATLTIEEINQDREKFLGLVNQNVNSELMKVGLEVINVNIRDITDESGYIDAIGRRAAAEAINTAKVEVAEADKGGAIGEASANREKQVLVAEQVAQSNMGQKQAERDQRIKVASLEADGIAGEANAERAKQIAVAEQNAKAVQGKKAAESKQRIEVATLEASAVEGENKSQAEIADYKATLEERKAEAKRRGEVATANAAKDVLEAEKQQELARLEKEEVAQQMIEQRKIEIQAEAEAERQRRIAKGEADAILAKYQAEAEGMQKVLEAKAEGYNRLIEVCGDRKDLAPSLLIIEKLPELVAEQVKAIQNLKIDKITVWDSGSGGGSGDGETVPTGSTGSFLRGLMGALPPMHELAQQAGIDLPKVLGQVADTKSSDAGRTTFEAVPVADEES